VRELENVVKRMIVLDDPDLSRTPFGSSGAGAGGRDAAPAGPGQGTTVSLKDVARSAARAAEREAIAHVLAQTGWNRVRSAKLLKISYRALLYKIKETGLDRG
jgi:DNA-binding NtrC family response regulator